MVWFGLVSDTHTIQYPQYRAQTVGILHVLIPYGSRDVCGLFVLAL